MTGWVLLILASVPFDVSAPFGFLPKLSLIDYEAAVALVVLAFRYDPRSMIRDIVRWMGVVPFVTWLVFLAYLIFAAIVLKGSIKDALRWGEFIFVYVLALFALHEDAPALRRGAAIVSAGFGSVIAVWGIVQFFTSGDDYTQTFAMFHQHNGFAAYLSLALPAAWALILVGTTRLQKAVAGLAAAAITFAFLLAYSRGAWLGIAGAVVVLGFLALIRQNRQRRALLLAMALFVASAALPVFWVIYREHTGQPVLVATLPFKARTSDSTRLLNLSARTYYWKTAADIIRQKTWFGLGPGRFADCLRSFLKGAALQLYDLDLRCNGRVLFWQHLHNAYLQFLVGYGCVGFALWAVAMALLSLPLFLWLPQASLLQRAFMVSGLAFLLHNGWDYLYVNSFDLVFAIWIALCIRKTPAADA